MAAPCDPILVIGSGAAGMSCALSLSPQPVLLLTKGKELASGSTPWAQGGIAAAVGLDDAAALHAADTVAAGAGLTDGLVSTLLAEDGPRAVARLLTLGMPFDRDAAGRLEMAREAAHGRARVVHAGGDSTGRALAATLAERVAETPSITVLTETIAVDLAVQDGRVRGVLVLDANGWRMIPASAVVLAAGGMGMAWRQTTNPAENTGDGVAMAARAGALLVDMEFMQFHPTALNVDDGSGARLPLLTEALRGAGAVLLDEQGSAFMRGEHELADLAPRDVVARAVGRRAAAGQPVFLDLRPALQKEGEGHFPQVLESCRHHGLDPWTQPVPVVPAAHYHMGGVVTDMRGRTTLAGLWACGEVACTGVHGANRLASNSLLEALVFGDRVAADVTLALADGRLSAVPGLCAVPLPSVCAPADARALCEDLRSTMSRRVGLVRDGAGLAEAANTLDHLAHRLRQCEQAGQTALGSQGVGLEAQAWAELRNLLTVSRLLVQSAQHRQESRGAHCRLDHPASRDVFRHRLTVRLGEAPRMADISPLFDALPSLQALPSWCQGSQP